MNNKNPKMLTYKKLQFCRVINQNIDAKECVGCTMC